MKLKVIVPESLDDIKISQYQKFYRTTKDSDDDNFIARQMVGIFCNIPDDVVGSIRALDFNEIVNSITKILNDKPKFRQTFKMDGVEYGFIPKLDDITLGEKIDIDNYLQDVKDLDKAISVLYRPITARFKDTYLIEEYKGDAKGLDCSMGIAMGATFFLTNLLRDLLIYTQSFIEGQVKHNDQVSQILEANGVDINQSMHYLKEISSNLTKWAS